MADEKMSDVSAQLDSGMDVESRERLDGLHEKLQQAKTLHSLNASQAEILYKSIIAEGSLPAFGFETLHFVIDVCEQNGTAKNLTRSRSRPSASLESFSLTCGC